MIQAYNKDRVWHKRQETVPDKYELTNICLITDIYYIISIYCKAT